MKVIDLLNKIANGEEIEKIKIMGMEYYIDEDNFLCDESGRIKRFIDDAWLNMPVEIIEDKKILKKLDCSSTDLIEAELIEKINEIIEYMNKGEIDEKNK